MELGWQVPPHPVVEMEGEGELLNFSRGWPGTAILLISTSGIAGIIDVTHFAWHFSWCFEEVSYFFIFRCLWFRMDIILKKFEVWNASALRRLKQET
jgi:hypothetical protein